MPALAAFAPAIIGAVGSIAGGALSNRNSQSATTTPTIDPKYSPLQDQILNMVQSRLSSPPDMSGYAGSGVSGINKSYGLVKATQDNNLTSRGLASSPVAGVVDANRENARAGDVAGFRNSIPLLSRQLQTEDLGLAGNVLNTGRGQSFNGSTSMGGGFGGAATNLAQYLGYLSGKGAFKGNNGSLYPVGGNGTNYAPSDMNGVG